MLTETEARDLVRRAAAGEEVRGDVEFGTAMNRAREMLFAAAMEQTAPIEIAPRLDLARRTHYILVRRVQGQIQDVSSDGKLGGIRKV